jgi:hypothetical protein
MLAGAGAGAGAQGKEDYFQAKGMSHSRSRTSSDVLYGISLKGICKYGQ